MELNPVPPQSVRNTGRKNGGMAVGTWTPGPLVGCIVRVQSGEKRE
jgi:hypothetical protein